MEGLSPAYGSDAHQLGSSRSVSPGSGSEGDAPTTTGVVPYWFDNGRMVFSNGKNFPVDSDAGRQRTRYCESSLARAPLLSEQVSESVTVLGTYGACTEHSDKGWWCSQKLTGCKTKDAGGRRRTAYAIGPTFFPGVVTTAGVMRTGHHFPKGESERKTRTKVNKTHIRRPRRVSDAKKAALTASAGGMSEQ